MISDQSDLIDFWLLVRKIRVSSDVDVIGCRLADWPTCRRIRRPMNRYFDGCDGVDISHGKRRHLGVSLLTFRPETESPICGKRGPDGGRSACSHWPMRSRPSGCRVAVHFGRCRRSDGQFADLTRPLESSDRRSGFRPRRGCSDSGRAANCDFDSGRIQGTARRLAVESTATSGRWKPMMRRPAATFGLLIKFRCLATAGVSGMHPADPSR